jgi:polysaccharide biosynthesis/export protein
MAELVDALVSGTSIRKDVQVRVLFRAPQVLNIIMKTAKVILFIFIFSVLFSCTPQKNYIYLQDKGNSDISATIKTFEYKIQPKDVLYIKTMSIDNESSLSLNSNSQSSDISGEQGAFLNGYCVNDSGYVELSLIGKVLVKDMTIQEIQKSIQEKVNFYLKNSIVVVKLLNFNITVLGEVNNPGNFSIYKTQLNILEAIGLAGELTVNGNRKEIAIVRHNNPEKITYVDLTDKNILQSEYFYLMPNDVIYIKPNKSKFFGTNPFPFATVISSITTLILILSYISK